MPDVFLIGGGRGEDAVRASHAPFVAAVGDGPNVAVVLHATQWGTLTRLVHAVRSGVASEGLAIDEGTVAVVRDGELASVEGLGAAYRVNSTLQLEVVRRW